MNVLLRILRWARWLPLYIPMVASAVIDPESVTIQDLIHEFTIEIINPIIMLLFALATAVFVWGVILYVIGSQGDDTKLRKGKQILIWGIIGMFMMASAWGIVNLLCDFFQSSAACPSAG